MPTSVDTGVTVLPSGLAVSSGLNIGERQSASAVDPNASGSVNWIRTSDGGVIAEIDAYIPDAGAAPNQHYARWNLTNLDGVDAPLTQIVQEVDSPAAGAKYLTRIIATAKAKAGGVFSRTIIDANGGSDFVQAIPSFGTPQVTQMYFGGQVVSMPGVGAGAMAEQTVTDAAFGNRTPTIVLAQLTTGGSIYFSQQWIMGTRNPGNNSFVISVWNNGGALGAGWTIGVWYIALFRAN